LAKFYLSYFVPCILLICSFFSTLFSQSLNALAAEFEQHYQKLDLITLLSQLATPVPGELRELIPDTHIEQRTMLFDAIAYLLRKDLIVQLQPYATVMVPPYVKLECTREQFEERLRDGTYDHTKTILTPISPPEQASRAERTWLNGLLASKPEETRSLADR
jgi:hypothetical protein